MAISFRHSAGFGKRIEYWVIGLLLKQGFDVYVPLVDDQGIDAIIRSDNGKIIDLQIKARGRGVAFGDAALFAAIDHLEMRSNYYFLFYSERLEIMWLMSSADFIAHAHQNKAGKNVGKRSLWFNNKSIKLKTEAPKSQYAQWCITKDDQHDFSRLREILSNL